MSIVSLACSGPPQDGPIDVYLLAGASNMGGRGGVAGAPPDALPPSLVQPQPAWVTYRTSNEEVLTLRACQPQGQSSVGPELSFVQSLLASSRPSTSKYAEGGSSLQEWIDTLYALGRVVWDGHLTQLREPSAPRGVFWASGAADANTEAQALMVGARATTLIEQFRTDYGPSMVFVFALPPADIDPVIAPFIAIVRDQYIALAASRSDTATVNIDDQPLLPDDLHYPSQTQVVLGQRSAAAMQSLL